MAKKTTQGKAAPKKESHTGLMVLGGLAVAAAAGAYFAYGNKEVQKKVKKVRSWALKAKGEVLEKIEKLKQIDEELYYKTIDAVVGKYQKIKSVDLGELTAVAKDLKSHWKQIKRELGSDTKKVKKAVKKTAKKAKDAIVK